MGARRRPASADFYPDHMTALFDFPLQSETLLPEEVADITGATRKGEQIAWLTDKEWTFHINRAGAPVVGRMYARLRMAGINPVGLVTAMGTGLPDFSKVR